MREDSVWIAGEGGWRVEAPTVFSTPLSHWQIIYWGVSNLYHNFGLAPTVEKFNPPVNFSQLKHWGERREEKDVELALMVE